MCGRTSMFQKTVICSASRLFKSSRVKPIDMNNIDLQLIFATLCFNFLKYIKLLSKEKRFHKVIVQKCVTYKSVHVK